MSPRDEIAAQRMAWLYEMGQVPYWQAWQWQQQLVSRLKGDPSALDVLLLLEHPPVYTLGQGATETFLKFQADRASYDLYRTERGGEVTYHCPGQLVGYPILNLHRYRQDLHWYLRRLEGVLISTLREYHLPASRIEGLTGVWIDGVKVAAIGIKVSRWITMHGFALNVCPDLSGFEQIVPCGIADRPVGSLAQFIPEISFAEVQRVITQKFAGSFGLSWLPGNPATLEQPS